jgi:hypothetical protein
MYLHLKKKKTTAEICLFMHTFKHQSTYQARKRTRAQANANTFIYTDNVFLSACYIRAYIDTHVYV